MSRYWPVLALLAFTGTGIGVLLGNGSDTLNAAEAAAPAEHGGSGHGEAAPEAKPEAKAEAKSEVKSEVKSEEANASSGATPKAGVDGAPPIAAIRERDRGAKCLADASAIEDLRRNRQELEARTKELVAREQELKDRERALEEQLSKLTALRDEIKGARNVQAQANEEKINKLVETVQTMSPKTAAPLLASIDERLAVETMGRLPTDKLAKIMNVMDPNSSSRLTELLAGLSKSKGKGGEKDGNPERSIQRAPGNDSGNSGSREPASASKS